MSTYILSLDFIENAQLMNYKSLGVSRMNAWRLLSHPEFCENPMFDYIKMLWEDKDDLLMAYFKTIEEEWRSRGYKSNLPLEAFENYDKYEIPQEWKQQKFIDSHRLMHNRLYKAYYSRGGDLEIVTEINQVFLNPYKLAEGIYESPELPEFLKNPRYCPGLVYDNSDPSISYNSSTCNFLLKHGQNLCKRHHHILNETKRCQHININGRKCFDRCSLDQLFCNTHKKHKEDLGESICQFASEHGECIRHVYEGSNFCRLHGGKPKKNKVIKEPKESNKKRKIGSKGKEECTDDRPMRAKHIPNSPTVEKFEVRGYEITKFQDTELEIKVVYRKL